MCSHLDLDLPLSRTYAQLSFKPSLNLRLILRFDPKLKPPTTSKRMAAVRDDAIEERAIEPMFTSSSGFTVTRETLRSVIAAASRTAGPTAAKVAT
jgi:hypothetical protein